MLCIISDGCSQIGGVKVFEWKWKHKGSLLCSLLSEESEVIWVRIKINNENFYGFISSPEPKAQGELLWSPTVRHRHRRRCRRHRPSVCLCSQSLTTSPPKPLIGIRPNFTGIILGWCSFKVVQMVPVHCISRSQELKIDFLTKNLKNLLVRNH